MNKLSDEEKETGEEERKLETYSLFVVFDGHSGSQIARRAAREFPNYLLRQEPFRHIVSETETRINFTELKDGDKYDVEVMKAGIRQAFLDFDKDMRDKASLYKLKTSGWYVYFTPYKLGCGKGL